MFSLLVFAYLQFFCIHQGNANKIKLKNKMISHSAYLPKFFNWMVDSELFAVLNGKNKMVWC